MANDSFISRFLNEPTVRRRVNKGLKAKKSLFSGVLVLVLTTPLLTYAGFFSFISSLFTQAEADTPLASAATSQTMPLLQGAVNPNPTPLAKGGGDISIVGGTALLPENGPNGSLADVGTYENQHGHISVYVVREGDTLSQIAKMYGVTTNTIAWNNDIQRGVIRPGQTLIILPISGIQHTVVKGDTVASIAKKYKADAEEIAQYNEISQSTALSIGTVIMVPDGELAPVATSPVTSNLRGAGGPEYSGYYLRPIIGGRRTQGLHGYNGVDLASSYGAPVLASAAGSVIVSRSGGYNGGYGSYIVVAHGNGTQTLYAHLGGVDVQVGEQVVQGQVIGAIGSTGKSTGPHLHFEIRGARNPF